MVIWNGINNLDKPIKERELMEARSVGTSISKERKGNTLLRLFEICLICINVIGLDAELYVISNGIIVLYFLYVAYVCGIRKWIIRAGRGLLYAFLAFGYVALSSAWAFNSGVAMSQVFSQIQMIILLFAVYETGILHEDIVYYYVRALYISAYLMIVYSLYAYGGLGGFIATFNSIGRMGGIVNGENGFGMLFAEGSIAAFYYLLYKGRKQAIIGALLFPLFSMTSGSKKAFFFILIGIVVLLITRYGIKRVYKALLGGIIILTALYFVIKLPVFGTMSRRLEQFFLRTNTSDIKREMFINAGLQLIHGWRAIVGYGLDNYKVATGMDVYSHNNYVESLVNFGILGTFIYYLMYIRGIIGALKATKIADIYVPVIIVFGLFISMEYGMVTMYTKEIWILLGIALAIADGGVIKSKEYVE